MIIEVTDELLMGQIRELLKKIKDAPVEHLYNMMVKGMVNLNEIILAYIDDYKVKGFLYATVNRFDGERSVFIQAAYLNPSNTNGRVSEIAFDKLRYWAKQRRIDRMDIITTRTPEAFSRRWKFEYTGTLMKRRI